MNWMLALFVILLTAIGAGLLWILIFGPIYKRSKEPDADPMVKEEGKS